MVINDLKEKIKKAAGMSAAVFSYPPDPRLGDLSLACFEAAKAARKSPVEMAISLEATLKEKKDLSGLFSNIKATGPYLNFEIDKTYLARTIYKEVHAAKEYGSNDGGKNRKVMVEYSNGNTHKEYHVGHLRNISFGDSIVRILRANGYGSIPVSYINDFGIHVAKTLWNWRRNEAYSKSSEPKGYLLGKCYAEASQLLAQDSAGKEEVGRIMKEIESRRGEYYKLWEETRLWSIEYFASIYKELGIHFERNFYESEVIDAGLALVDRLFKEGILVKSEGAIIADLEKYGLGVLPIIRSDGTALYPVADLALASEKFEKFDLDESVYIVDVRQSLYFKQLFKILELIGYKQQLVHLPYDFVTLPEGMMSSRSGNVITYQELRDKILARLIEETAARHKDWSEDRVRQVAMSLTVSTIKFEMLKVSADKIITFNINEALRFDGYTACYLQYGYARLRSIVRKKGFSLPIGPDFSVLVEDKEKELLLKIARFPEAVALAGGKYNPSEITRYLFELVQVSNDYYHGFNILKAEPKVRRARLALVDLAIRTLYNGFGLLGMEPLDEM